MTRKKEKKPKNWRRAGKKSRHHIQNKTNGGKNQAWNILWLDINRHRAWHYLFLNKHMKKVREELLNGHIAFADEEKKKAWIFLFGDKTKNEVARLLFRTLRAKRHLKEARCEL